MFRSILFLLCVFLLCPPILMSEELSLQVLDSSGAVVPRAVVEIRGPAQVFQVLSLVADGEGRIEAWAQLPVTVQVKAPGFEPLSQRIEVLTAEQITLRLAPAILNTTVEVFVQDDPAFEESVERSALVIERSGARTVYEAVDKLIPSAHVPRRGILGHGLGTSNSMSLRGLGGSPTTELLIVVDGRPDVMGLMGHPIPDFYSLTDVGSISVTSGPASVLYGNRAMGGVIEITPAPSEPGFHTELSAGLGSYYTGQYRLLHGGQMGRFYYGLSGGVEHTNGDRENSSFRNQDGTVDLSYDLTPAWRASLQGRYGHFNVEDPGTVQAPTPGHWSRVGRGGFTASLENRGETAWGNVSLFSSYGHHMIWDGFRSVDNNAGFRAKETLALRPGLEVDLGADAARYGGKARNIASGFAYGEHHEAEGGGFVRGRWSVTEKLRVNAGVRYDHSSVFGGVSAAEFGASYHLAEGYAFSMAVAKGYRNPTIRELYLFPAPTPTLKPERLWNYQATFQLRPLSRLLAWVTGYYSDASNLIVTTGRYPNMKLENIGYALNRGLEANARLRVSRRVSLSSGYAYLRSTNLAPYVPQNKANYSLDIDLSRAFVSIGGSTVGRTWANTARTQKLGGYTAMTLRCTVPVGRHWNFFAMVDNLLDREYQEIAGYPMPGTNAAGGFKVKF
jgi:iron complex outermembrane receptor protein